MAAMSYLPATEPRCRQDEAPAVDLVIESRPRDLGGFSVRRVLPAAARRLVGPFIFVDEMGPASFEAGQGIDVRPHPHIGIATVTYLFEGQIFHRDSVGSALPIEPGAVNWMVAGRGIAHSERTAPDRRAGGLHGVQAWVALPREHEETEPSFEHHPAETLPWIERPNARFRLIAGEALGARSPVRTHGRLFYLHGELEAEAQIPAIDHVERGIYIVSGELEVAGEHHGPHRMLVLRPGAAPSIRATRPTRVMILGGDPIDGERHIWWNFVSSSKARIEQAKRDWNDGRFDAVAGDEQERIPLPAS